MAYFFAGLGVLALLEFCEKFQSFEVTICPASINHVTNTIEVKYTRFRLIEVLVPSKQFIVRFLITVVHLLRDTLAVSFQNSLIFLQWKWRRRTWQGASQPRSYKFPMGPTKLFLVSKRFPRLNVRFILLTKLPLDLLPYRFFGQHSTILLGLHVSLQMVNTCHNKLFTQSKQLRLYLLTHEYNQLDNGIH